MGKKQDDLDMGRFLVEEADGAACMLCGGEPGVECPCTVKRKRAQEWLWEHREELLQDAKEHADCALLGLMVLDRATTAEREVERLKSTAQVERSCNLANTAELHRADDLIGVLKEEIKALKEARDQTEELLTATKDALHTAINRLARLLEAAVKKG